MIDRIERYLFLSKRINNSSQERDQDNILLKRQYLQIQRMMLLRGVNIHTPSLQYSMEGLC